MKHRIRKIALIGMMASGIAPAAFGDGVTPPEPRPTQVATPKSSPANALPAALPTNDRQVATEAATEQPVDPAPQSDVPDSTSADVVQHDTLIDESKLEVIEERYPSGAIRIERHVRQDADLNYVKHGSWRYLSEQGAVIAEGLYVDGKMHGPWQRWHRGDDAKLFQESPYDQFAAPFFSEATFKQGKLDGKWVVYDSKQRTISEIELRNGQRHGQACWWYPNGQKSRQITFKNGVVDGDVIRWDEAGEVTVRKSYLDGRLLDVQTTMYEGTQTPKSEVSYLSPQTVIKNPDDWWHAKTATFGTVGEKQRHGKWTSYHKSGHKLGQGEYKLGKPVGDYRSWHDNGQLASRGQYDDGQQVGTWTWWYANGQKYVEGHFVAGKKAGLWVWWKQDGSVAHKQQMDGSTVAQKPDEGKTL